MLEIRDIVTAYGKIEVLEGEEITGRGAADIVSRGVALVPENRLVFPQTSVTENLDAGAYQRRDPDRLLVFRL